MRKYVAARTRARARNKKGAAPRVADAAVFADEPTPITINEHAHGDDSHYTSFKEIVFRERLLPEDGAERKLYPVATGVVDYFPDALAAVAVISHAGNEKHNPGEPLHWARGKSMDHADCIMRHLIQRGGRDQDGNRHSAQLAWRALALLQQELEAELGLAPPRGTEPSNFNFDMFP